MRQGTIAGMALLLGVLSLGLPGRAQEAGPWRHGFAEGGFGQGGIGGRGEHRMGQRLMAMLESDRAKTALGLTDQQTDQLRKIMVEAQKSTLKMRADMAVRGIELRELLRADKPDRDTVMKKVQEISNLRGEMMKQHIDGLLAAKAVLTPEQQKKFRTLMERRGGREFGRERYFNRRLPGPPESPGAAPEPPRDPDEPPVQ